MSKRSSAPPRIVAAALVGFVAGAGAAVLVWNLRNIMPSPDPRRQYPADRPPVLEWRELPPVHDDGSRDVLDTRPGPAASPPAVGNPPIPSSTTMRIFEVDPLLELRVRQLELPVHGVTRQELRDSFDQTRGSTHKHEAIDIMAPRNTQVLAVEDGTIVRLFESKPGGTTVYQFDPTTRYAYYYAHLERYADGLHEGNHVQRGQVLGYVGTSGNAPKDAPHLHFAIFRLTEDKRWWHGSPINPYGVLK